jgi:hypothetical protein
VNNEEKSIDFSSRKVVAMRDVQEAVAGGATRIVIAESCVVTPSAKDFLQQRNVRNPDSAIHHYRRLSQPHSRQSPPF